MASLHFPAISLSSHSLNKPPQLSLLSSLPHSSNLSYHIFNFHSFTSRQKLGFQPKNSITVSSNQQQIEPMVPSYNVLITGSTKGIGYAFAREFIKAAERVQSAIQNLSEEFGEQRVWGTTCDVKEGKDVKALVAFACDKLKHIDIWINNAGSNAYSYRPLAETSDEDLIEVVTTNTLGLMICCREAINMMLNQHRGGHVFNMDGAGSDGRPTPRFAAYGATKRSVVHLTKSLQPGMVTTDLLMSGATTKQAKFFINVLAEPADVVAEYLIPNIRSILSNGSTKPTYLRFLTGLKAYSQIFSRFAFGARRNRYVLED
ncbi:hypothetical protein IFM89_035659 [Coptis chinensis]|uniref:Chlorophyll(Ide) b reductase NOL, chloroplastic n=1 Tax=Coptis chinensis TaxID=261450 RepID=A0A835LLD1_9MAGN|nr:hypothetical protein IFM89_035659 [Coptis chinensis]